MNANDVIESYVTDVAVQLPRKQRNDVAFELRALLQRGIAGQGRELPGASADAAMATELVRAFGRPADVAARYRPTLTDHRSRGRTGVPARRWRRPGDHLGAGLVVALRQPIESGWGILTPLGQWWGGVVIPSLWWPGVLVVGYGMAARARLAARGGVESARGGARRAESRGCRLRDARDHVRRVRAHRPALGGRRVLRRERRAGDRLGTHLYT